MTTWCHLSHCLILFFTTLILLAVSCTSWNTQRLYQQTVVPDEKNTAVLPEETCTSWQQPTLVPAYGCTSWKHTRVVQTVSSVTRLSTGTSVDLQFHIANCTLLNSWLCTFYWPLDKWKLVILSKEMFWGRLYLIVIFTDMRLASSPDVNLTFLLTSVNALELSIDTF